MTSFLVYFTVKNLFTVSIERLLRCNACSQLSGGSIKSCLREHPGCLGSVDIMVIVEPLSISLLAVVGVSGHYR